MAMQTLTREIQEENSGRRAPRKKPRVKWLRLLVSSVLLLILMIVWGLFMRGTLRAMEVGSGSMEPTLQPNDRLIVRNTGKGRIPKGVIVTLESPDDDGPDLVKRVVAVPGDIVSFQDGLFYVNGDISPPPSGRLFHHSRTHDLFYKLKEDEYFVMGDNRGKSYDSEEFGPIGRSLINGYVVYRYGPSGRVGRVE